MTSTGESGKRRNRERPASTRIDSDISPEPRSAVKVTLAPWRLPLNLLCDLTAAFQAIVGDNAGTLLDHFEAMVGLMQRSAPNLITLEGLTLLLFSGGVSASICTFGEAAGFAVLTRVASTPHNSPFSLLRAVEALRESGRIRPEFGFAVPRNWILNEFALHAEVRRDRIIALLLTPEFSCADRKRLAEFVIRYSQLELLILQAEREILRRFLARPGSGPPRRAAITEPGEAIHNHASRILGRRNVFQALRQYAFLEPYIDVSQQHTAWIRARRSISWAVPKSDIGKLLPIDSAGIIAAAERGESLPEYLVRAAGVPRQVLRRIVGLPRHQAPTLDTARNMGRLPAVMLHEMQLSQFYPVTEAFEKLANAHGGLLVPSIEGACAEPRVPPLRALLLDGYAPSLLDYVEFLMGVFEWLNILTPNPMPPLELIGPLSLDDWLVLSARWHSVEASLRRKYECVKMRGSPTDVGVPLFQESKTINGYRFTPLVTTEALRLEGERMKHCVGNYATWGLSRGQHILSISLEKLPTATLELECYRGQLGDVHCKIKQLVGMANRAPPDGVRSATATLIGEIESGRQHIQDPAARSASVDELHVRQRGQVRRAALFLVAVSWDGVAAVDRYRWALQRRGGSSALFDDIRAAVTSLCGNPPLGPPSQQLAERPNTHFAGTLRP